MVECPPNRSPLYATLYEKQLIHVDLYIFLNTIYSFCLITTNNYYFRVKLYYIFDYRKKKEREREREREREVIFLQKKKNAAVHVSQSNKSKNERLHNNAHSF